MKYINQKGPFHYTYLSISENDKNGFACVHNNNGECLKDNKKCMNDSYCNFYTIDENERIVLPQNNTYRKCPICDLNYICGDGEMCDICAEKEFLNTRKLDNNLHVVEKDLVPFLQNLSPDKIILLTKADFSLKYFGMHLPLLVECLNNGIEQCRKEVIVDNSATYRYYIQPIKIHNKYYHICSQWAGVSKHILYIMQKLK